MLSLFRFISFSVVLFVSCSAFAAQDPFVFRPNPAAGGTIDAIYVGPIGAGGTAGYNASSSGGGAAGLNMSANVGVTVGAPTGSAIGLALAGVAGAAIIAAGGSTTADHYAPSIFNPALLIPLAGQALVMGSGICGPAMPVCLAAGIAATLAPTASAAVGSTFFSAMTNQGLGFGADGSAKVFTCPDGSRVPPYAQCSTGGTPSNCTVGGTAYNCSPAINDPIQGPWCNTPTWIHNGVPGFEGAYGMTCIAYVVAGAPGVPSQTVATNADILAALDVVVGSNNRATASANQNAAAADEINLALLGGMSLSSMAETAALTRVASAFTQQSQTNDALGNTIQQLSRNIVTLSPGANPSLPPVAIPSQEKITVTNGSATGSTTISTGGPIPVAISPAATIATAAANVALSDQCLLHPEILACANIINLHDLPTVSVPNRDINLNLTPVSLGGPAICPPPLVLPGMMGGPPMVLDLARPICDFATAIRAINLICGGLASFFIISLGFKNNG